MGIKILSPTDQQLALLGQNPGPSLEAETRKKKGLPAQWGQVSLIGDRFSITI
jgi:hypothetical protein